MGGKSDNSKAKLVKWWPNVISARKERIMKGWRYGSRGRVLD
jgi:hypothetical protein